MMRGGKSFAHRRIGYSKRMPSMEHEAIALVRAFSDALNARDVDGMMRCLTRDCIFENTYPAPDGTRYVGQADVRAFWQDFFDSTPAVHFESQELFAADDRCVMLWKYEWTDHHGAQGHVRGVDVYRIENHLIAEKLAYVKG